MKLSTRARYGTRAMIDLAMSYGKGLVLLKDIARRQQISGRYLEQIMIKLISSGFVQSVRGSRGGFILAKPPKDIILSDLIQALEGSIAPVPCVDNLKFCKLSKVCVTKDIWELMKKAMVDVLEKITLEDMVKMQKEKMTTQESPQYFI